MSFQWGRQSTQRCALSTQGPYLLQNIQIKITQIQNAQIQKYTNQNNTNAKNTNTKI